MNIFYILALKYGFLDTLTLKFKSKGLLQNEGLFFIFKLISFNISKIIPFFKRIHS